MIAHQLNKVIKPEYTICSAICSNSFTGILCIDLNRKDNKKETKVFLIKLIDNTFWLVNWRPQQLLITHSDRFDRLTDVSNTNLRMCLASSTIASCVVETYTIFVSSDYKYNEQNMDCICICDGMNQKQYSMRIDDTNNSTIGLCFTLCSVYSSRYARA